MTKESTTKKISSVLPLPVESIARQIHFIRGQKIMLDRDLAELYDVRPIALRQRVKRNTSRFPKDFKFRLTRAEADFLVSQNVIPSRRSLGGFLPYAFTQEGVAMLSSVLHSQRAIQVNIAIMRAFVRLRESMITHGNFARRIQELEQKYAKHDDSIGKFKEVFDALKKLTQAPPPPHQHRKIGFLASAK
jgi:hypothetical protein